MDRVAGDNHHGNSNEYALVDALNGKQIKYLNSNLKEFLKFICSNFSIIYNENLTLDSSIESNSNLKQDLYLNIAEKTLGVSLKMGTGNSVHQEKCEDFIDYIKNKFNANDKICDDIRFFIWADGTLDGTGSLKKDGDGKIKSRFTSSEFKKKYPEKRQNIQRFLNLHEEDLIRHFMLDGRHNSQIDIIYHGTPINGSWITSEKAVSYQLENSRSKNSKDRSCFSVGRMTLQVWNVSQKGSSEKKRGQIQLKYGDMKEDFYKLMKLSAGNIGTFFGDTEEFDISRFLNKDKQNKMWSEFNLEQYSDLKNLYAVKVEKRVLSKLSDRLVHPKSDAYLICAEIPIEYLLSHEYVLTETNISKFDYIIVDDSGISVKLKDSKRFTIQKFTRESFYKAFRSYIEYSVELIFVGLLVYSNEKEMFKNQKVFEDLKIDTEQLRIYFGNLLNNNQLNLNQKEDLNSIRKKSQEMVKTTITENEKLMKSIFTGEGWFENPYYAKYIYRDGNLVHNEITDFSITTGSGRSKGKYSIEIKPK